MKKVHYWKAYFSQDCGCMSQNPNVFVTVEMELAGKIIVTANNVGDNNLNEDSTKINQNHRDVTRLDELTPALAKTSREFYSKYGKEEAIRKKNENLSKEEAEERSMEISKHFPISHFSAMLGLGNVWRFSVIAYKYGGGTFLIPYLIVLVAIGAPMFYLENAMGQFTGSHCIGVWSMCPALKGIGYTQAVGTCYMLSYYVSVITYFMFYVFLCFEPTLPWTVCQKEWENCVPTNGKANITGGGDGFVSSAEYYFLKTVLKQETFGIDEGIHPPLWYLTIYLFLAWTILLILVVREIQLNKTSSVLIAAWPCFLMVFLLLRSMALPGAANGLYYYVKPEWDDMWDFDLWYAVVTQIFFTFSICSGVLITRASQNQFRHNIFKDTVIIMVIDTFTSISSGATVFSVLGNLAHDLNKSNMSDVIRYDGTSIVFVSYTTIISKSPQPNLFCVLVFLTIVIIGFGSATAYVRTIIIVILSSFPNLVRFYVTVCNCIVGFFVGLFFVTPNGQFILALVGNYGGSFIRLAAATLETIGVGWIYGLNNFCLDIEYMTGKRTSFFMRVCWGIILPVFGIFLLIYALIAAYALILPGRILGTFLRYLPVSVIPIYIALALWKHRTGRACETASKAFSKTSDYGPRDKNERHNWEEFCRNAKMERDLPKQNHLHHLYLSLIDGYRRKT